jgi:hypothetical protein
MQLWKGYFIKFQIKKMRRMKAYIMCSIIIINVLSCKSGDSTSDVTINENPIEQNDESETINEINENSQIQDVVSEIENFDDFFENFKNDLSFRSSRLKSPIILFKADEPTEQHPDGFFPLEVDFEEILLSDKEWDDKVSYTITKKEERQIVILLEGTNNYIKMEYTFVLEANVWMLQSFKDLAI